MRVIAGKAKGRKLLAVPGDSTRPILDRVKTSLFDILRPELENIMILDLFAGSGAVGIEALSQGASHCIFLDLNKNAAETIRKNLETTQLADSAEVRHTDAFSYLKHTSKAFHLIYIAPPQYQTLWIDALRMIGERPEIVTESGLIVVQVDPKEFEEIELRDFKEEQQRKYGNTLLAFYRKSPT